MYGECILNEALQESSISTDCDESVKNSRVLPCESESRRQFSRKRKVSYYISKNEQIFRYSFDIHSEYKSRLERSASDSSCTAPFNFSL